MLLFRKMFRTLRFRETDAKQAKHFAKQQLVSLVSLFHETAIHRFVKNPNRNAIALYIYCSRHKGVVIAIYIYRSDNIRTVITS
jgi:hypothetical protein